MTAEEIIQRAMQAQEEKAGVRMKVRMPNALWKRVTRCADAASMYVEDWALLAARAWMQGRFAGVSFDRKELLVTREDSEPVWMRVPHDMDPRHIRQSVLQAVAWHEPKIRLPTPQPGTENWVEGRDYVVEARG